MCLCVRVCVCVCVFVSFWCNTCAGQLLLVSAWLQVSVLKGYNKRQVARARFSVITRALSTGSHNHS